MTQQREQEITVKPDTLNKLASAVERGANDSGAETSIAEEEQGG